MIILSDFSGGNHLFPRLAELGAMVEVRVAIVRVGNGLEIQW